jgi:hypothetical protein
VEEWGTLVWSKLALMMPLDLFWHGWSGLETLWRRWP